jgi:N-acetylglucosamine malate deacetylase 2
MTPPRILYIFPHPDDESFGPALAIARQRREGHHTHLLTLTRGGATEERHRLGLSLEEMGVVRLREMRGVERVLELTSMTVLDLPDSGLAELDPRELEIVVEAHVRRVRPDVIVTYPVHGVSGYPDHLVTHAVVKRVFCALRHQIPELRRLAFFTLAEAREPSGRFSLHVSPAEAIDVAMDVDGQDRRTASAALACHETYAEVIRERDPLGRVGRTVYFELFQETYDPPLPCVTADL